MRSFMISRLWLEVGVLYESFFIYILLFIISFMSSFMIKFFMSLSFICL